MLESVGSRNWDLDLTQNGGIESVGSRNWDLDLTQNGGICRHRKILIEGL